MERRVELDALRGLMLVLMTVTHVPTWYGGRWSQPFGLVSAAEGFVFVSAFLVGCVYGRIARTRGTAAMRRRLWRRTGVIYAAHAAMLLFLFVVVVPLAVRRNAHAVTDLASFYLAQPHAALLGSLTLLYDPPLLDILPMYVVFMAASPWLLSAAARHGFAPLAAASVGLWLLAQAGAGRALHDALVPLGLFVPYRETGAFSWLAWQLLWVLGMWAGAATDHGKMPRLPRPVYLVAGAVAVAGLVVRYALGQAPEGAPWLPAAFDKWHLGPLRLLDFGALLVLVAGTTPLIRCLAQRSPLTTLGRAALPVFCAHLAICLVALATVSEVAPPILGWRDTLLLGATLAAMLCVARLRLALQPRVEALSALGGMLQPRPPLRRALSATPGRTAR